ncbi:Nuclear pore complex protein [Pseudolycoriella hygida]|uniref:Nuclear pore complex protein n=1 Tax=Pseudolycoriella hygida TaxID=35572 RepID=A0A9Q0S7A3_9DIPT|nr:Nuclear pore complex protein [Pseudolycoriella hygida]
MNISEINSQSDSIEYAGNMLERHDMYDNSAPSLLEVTGITQHGMATASGLNDFDYQSLTTLSMGLKNLNQIETLNKIPIPPEVMEHFNHINCHCVMGLFPEIGRAWLTIDSDIYIWTYEHGRDAAYFDGLNHLIVSVGLVKPKPGVFISDVKYLLILTTPIEIVVLGVTFGNTTQSASSAPSDTNEYSEMQLMNKPIFIINTEVAITTVVGTKDQRIFLGGRDGCLYEICYRAESTWLGKRCWKTNHSQGLMSYMVPGFLKVFSEVDAIVKIVVDDSRHLLYTLSERGAIEAWDLGTTSDTTRRLFRISQNDIAYYARNILTDCPNLHMLAVTQHGVRLYFSTIPLVQQQNSNQPNEAAKPQGLYLLHVRLPPGYTPNATIGKPKLIHAAFHSNGTLLMVSTPQQDQDVLWSLSSEPFPLRPYLAESSTVMPLNGQVWGIAEMKSDTESSVVNPLQNAKTNKKVVLLTNHGVQVISLVKPTYMLMHLLLACHGPHHEAIKGYFQSQTEANACATSVLLACMEAFRGTDIGVWATQAFLLYGGEPNYGGNYLVLNQATVTRQLSSQWPNNRNMQMFMSTPLHSTPRNVVTFQQQQQQLQMSPISNQIINPATGGDSNLCFSYKHAGLYLHICRLLRPIWKKKCIVAVDANSSITNFDCAHILDDLYAVKSFIDTFSMNNMSNYLGQSSLSNTFGTFAGSDNTINRQQLEQAMAEEKKSINALALFIRHACEVIGLWKILCEHQFPLLFRSLQKEEQDILSCCTFRDLILSRADTCAQFIVSLINTYLNDNATIAAISSKLRDVCPNLYRHEDAVAHKATEILISSRNCIDQEEQKEKLHTALQLCKDAAPNLPLANICQQFTLANFYQGVIELCAICASKIDPNGAALHFYKNNEPPGDQEGYILFSTRMDFYKEVKLMLDHFYTTAYNKNASRDLTRSGLVESQEQTLNSQILKIVNLTLQTNDQLLHNSVYEWLLAHNLLTELLDISEPSLGEFLMHSVKRRPDDLGLADLLWKYHELNGQHAAATNILDNLASMQSEAIPLNQRIEYLSRAVMCMRSDTIGYSANNGFLLKNLEDKLDIARVQKLLLDALSNQNDLECQRACRELNSQLFDLTQLYTDFAERFDMPECKLTILNCSHHHDPLLVESVWTQILDREMQQPGSPYEKSSRLLSKVQVLAKEYITSGNCFPVAFLVHELELRCCQLRLEQSPAPDALIAIGIEVDLLLDIYARMISMNERVWATEGNEYHLVQATTRLIAAIVAQPNLISARNRRRVVLKAQDLTSACRSVLHPKPLNDTRYMIDALLDIEAKLQRI